MAGDLELSRTEMERWFREVHLREDPTLSSRWDSFSPEEQQRLMDDAISREINLRINNEARRRLGERIAAGENIPEGQVDAVTQEIRNQILEENAEDLQSRQQDNSTNTPADRQPQARQRSQMSDNNEYMMDQLRIATLHDMGVISDEEANNGNLTEREAIELVNRHVPGLSDEQLEDMEERMAKSIVDNEELLPLIPPSVLANLYNKTNEDLQHPENDEERQTLTTRKEKVAARIDDITDMFAEHRGLYFADVTNIADVYDGYMDMFKAREPDLQAEAQNNEHPSTEAQNRLQKIADCRTVLDRELNGYEEEHNLTNVTENDGETLSKNFDSLSKKMEDISLSPETMQVVSNFKFLDKDGKVEPQFVDENGRDSDTWTPNSKVKEGSKLDIAIRLAKQSSLTDNLTNKNQDSLTPEVLQEDIAAHLIEETLYPMYVQSNVPYEDPNQFTNPAFAAEFNRKLHDTEHPMSVTNDAFEKTVDVLNDANAGYAQSLARKLGKGNVKDGAKNDVVGKLFNPIQDIDKRAAARKGVEKESRKAIWADVSMRSLKIFGNAAAYSALITGVSTIAANAAADVSATVATMGTNKVAGLVASGIGVAVGVGMSIKQIRQWRKEKKAKGESCGFKAFFKDKRLLASIGTTTLGCAALGFAVTGNTMAATACGLTAMGLGISNGAVSTYNDVRARGLSKWEAALAGLTVGSAGALGGLAGRAGANYAIDSFNRMNPDNTIFQHKEIVGQREVIDKDYTIRTTDEQAIQDSKNILQKWGMGEVMDEKAAQITDALKAYDAEHGTHYAEQIDPYRAQHLGHTLFKIDTLDNNLNHVQGGPDIHTHGNHTVLNQQTIQNNYGISSEGFSGAHDFLTDPSKGITLDTIDALMKADTHLHLGGQFDLGLVDGKVPDYTGMPRQDDGVLSYNTHQEGTANVSDIGNPNGKPEFYTTYAEGADVHGQQHIFESHKVDVEGLVGTKVPWYQSLDMIGNFFTRPKETFKGIVGSLRDRIAGKKHRPEPPQPEPVNIKIDKMPTALPLHAESLKGRIAGYIPAEPESLKKKKEEKTPIVLPPVEDLLKKDQKPVFNIPPAKKTALLPEIAQSLARVREKTDEKPGYDKLLADEYKIMYGVEPKVVNGHNPQEQAKYEHWLRYNERVNTELEQRNQANPDAQIDMLGFLSERRAKLDEVIANVGNTFVLECGKNVDGAKQVFDGDSPVLDDNGNPKFEIAVKKDYEAHKDNPGNAAVINQARQSLQQSNMTTENYQEAATLSHFTDYVEHFVKSDDMVKTGTRDITKVGLRKITKALQGKKAVKMMDLNAHYFGDAGQNSTGATGDFYTVQTVDHGVERALYEIRDNHFPEEHNQQRYKTGLKAQEQTVKNNNQRK